MPNRIRRGLASTTGYMVIFLVELMEMKVNGQEELHQTRWDPAVLHQTRWDPHTPCQEAQLIAWGAALRRHRPGKATPEQLRQDRTELLELGKELRAYREPTKELLLEARAMAAGPRALLDSAQHRRQRRRRRGLLRDTTAKAPVHHRITCGLILVESRLSSCSTHESST